MLALVGAGAGDWRWVLTVRPAPFSELAQNVGEEEVLRQLNELVYNAVTVLPVAMKARGLRVSPALQ